MAIHFLIFAKKIIKSRTIKITIKYMKQSYEIALGRLTALNLESQLFFCYKYIIIQEVKYPARKIN